MANKSEFEEILSAVNRHHEETQQEEFQVKTEISGQARRADREPKKKNNKPVIAVIAAVLIVAVCAGVFFLTRGGGKPEKTTTAAAKVAVTSKTGSYLNPLTGEDGYRKAAVGKRPVCVVVENEYSTEAVRPQWGLDKADIVLEGESEYSTRLHLFFADYTAMPSQIGPARSARPPFIRFANLFDAVFIHAGLSKSKGNYLGANDVFKQEKVDHINLLNLSDDGTYFGRDRSRGASTEHTAFLNGSNVEALLKEKDIRTEADSAHFTALAFNEEAKPLGEAAAKGVTFRWAHASQGGICPKTGTFTYEESSKTYTTTDFDSQYGKAGVAFKNLVLLLDETEYVVKSNYGGRGADQTYCDYRLKSGKGVALSEGTYTEITWSVKNGKLVLKDAAGEPLKLNPGKTYFALGSSNHGGSWEIQS